MQYLLLDAAQLGSEIYTAFTINPRFSSLYFGESRKVLEAVAPYLFMLEEHDPLLDWFEKNGSGKAWGIFLSTEVDFDACLIHFRKFLIAETENGHKFYFRFYDPRVLNMFFPTCPKASVNQFFAEIEYFICETDDSSGKIKWTNCDGEATANLIN